MIVQWYLLYRTIVNWLWVLTPIILVMPEAEMRRMVVLNQPKLFTRIYLKSIQQNQDWQSGSSGRVPAEQHEALSSYLSTTK
jgi:hypothetical protein